MNVSIDRLPKLLYIGDTPVESSYHGSALIYRLLEDYPSSKLTIIEGNLFTSQPDRQLTNIKYKQLCVGNTRIFNTRFNPIVSSFLSWTARSRASKIKDLLGDFQPEAVLTVGIYCSWLTASQFAQNYHLPLHLIVHDDLSHARSFFSNRWLDAEFGSVYRQAKSRLCVSPYMSEEYKKRYGVTGSVLYPSRGKNVQKYISNRLDQSNDTNRPLTIVFGGTVNQYSPQLRTVADCLDKIGGRLIIYGPLTKESAINVGLGADNIKIGGLLPANQFIDRIRAEADILLVPMSFASKDQANMQLSFPSKLTDYTAVGLPLLIYGPSYCSAVRWANENPGVAEVVTSEDSCSIILALKRLLSPKYRLALAKEASIKGDIFFSHSRAHSQFISHLL
jgi:hypothetical protein